MSFLEETEPSSDRVLAALARAEDAVSRLDARVTASELAQGWRARVACHEAVAWRWNLGDSAPLEAVVLHDARLGQAAPEVSVSRAVGALSRRRRAARATAEELSGWTGVQRLIGRRPVEPGRRSEASEALMAAVAPRRPESLVRQAAPSPPLSILGAMSWPPCSCDQDEEVFAFWLAQVADLERHPALVRAAAAMDLWVLLQPLGQETDVGSLIVEVRLREIRRLRATPLLVEMGRRALSRQSRYWDARAPAAARLCFWLEAIARGAEAGSAELDLLTIARQRLDLALRARRSTSRLPALADLLLRSPVVSAPMVAEALGVSGQAARTLLGELSGIVREVTGRASYRLWRI